MWQIIHCRRNDHEYIAIEIIQMKHIEKKTLKSKKVSYKLMRHRKKLKQPNIHVIGISEGRECSRKYICKVNKSINSQIQEVQITPRMRNLEKITSSL